MTRAPTFWGQRRAAVKAEEIAIADAEKAAQEAAYQQTLAEKSDEEILQELDLPDPETLKLGDDFAAFMAQAVPEHLRKRALRKLWRSNPVLACVDGLNDYDDDYLTGSFGNAPITTSYQVGKGLLSHVLEMAKPDEVEASEQTTLDKVEILAEDIQQEDLVADAGTDVLAEDVEEPEFSSPRRMVFHFDGSDA
ncbi:DUF3306 domain-containing protein [Falsihalocynthiibacter arcticus]|uniref:DUF3306 domain-containing protein n=1 Tax=Falsihalocynthiibacter arcticus TaxID=1579316 RepID=A0A126V141_9RHOB|nr:DUF3306 domain-containing protein [Falsihalocynthiibacter arcticus]AML52013.1 hypothetical protein RC74_12695 [Falsihalocynthiibacter arcticus]